MKPIPIRSAEKIAKEFGYDQVMIYARKVDAPAGVGENAKSEIKGGEHMTTYGAGAKHCAAAAQIGDFLKFKIMGWTNEEPHEDRRYEALTKALESILDAIDDMRLSNRLKEIERIAVAALLEARGYPLASHQSASPQEGQ